ncbi:MAG: hypothetical protein PUI82_00070 [Firmicutes bacterium]|nr:hypothetical protein [Bacillota bacterium]
MNKIKDFFYNKNDIIVVLLILAAAAFVIYDRMEVVMNYPEVYAQSIEQESSASADNGDSNADKASAGTDADAAAKVKFTVKENDTLSDIAARLESEGLIKSADEFVDFAVEKKKESSIIAGSYEITKGSSDEDILGVITK